MPLTARGTPPTVGARCGGEEARGVGAPEVAKGGDDGRRRTGLRRRTARTGRPLRVEIVGLFPLYFKMCPRAMPWAFACGLEWPTDQEREYPEPERRRQRQLGQLVRHLAARFGDQVEPVTVPLTSPRGAWLAARHRLRSDEMAVVVGGRCVRVEGDYAAVDRWLEACLGRDASP